MHIKIWFKNGNVEVFSNVYQTKQGNNKTTISLNNNDVIDFETNKIKQIEHYRN